MKPLATILALVLLTGCASSSVTLVHFTDYHSHATPFYAGGERDAAGIARAYAFVEPLSKRRDVIVLNGGDTMNLGAPPWSDKFRCVEWPWWNGVVDAMAYGNHDADYGPEVFRDCQASIDYPILGANVVDGGGSPVFARDYLVLERRGRRIGLFAVAGSDFPSLLKPATSPVAGVAFTDRIEKAREIVRALREIERVDLVVLFGHAHNEDDAALARAVPGIDLVLGTHSHKTMQLERIEGTGTSMIASGQYLENVAVVRVRFEGEAIASIDGEVVPMDAPRPMDSTIARRVASLDAELRADPRWTHLFDVSGSLESALPNDGVNERTTEIGRFVLDAVRRASGADVAISTSSSFRGGLPAGPVTGADLLDILPYDNEVLVYEMSERELAAILERAAEASGTDSFLQLSGATIAAPTTGEKTWRVATTDYLARVSPVWKDLFEGLPFRATGLRVRAIVREALRAKETN